uniref:tripartite motif-containing protein 16-like n=1 Tax=Oncorhynchus gorbuscha TaxID=8017 RepID=UPI001EAECE7E|nr:tripartite motif-containing protein 16-like [Oncorhynchus gorbuscha]XP_046174407.1 tripartite motif-containing protein 16-like [Oncorhynchus gorbuscha]XP_046174408.1 tripartite motif-containing protein 16-like [Oncorhynchus gorbuscha]XP_046174410.1 tripartite motif-containing protein 16-like [Oncorhynchus gorbuscha]
MAEQGVLLDQDQFCCSICLDLLKEPVTINCGHSYCSNCIEDCWDKDDPNGSYNCPQCRQTFSPRPALMKNSLLAMVVGNMRKIGLQPTTPALCFAGPGDVECDFCNGRKQKALKSCLVCLASYCETHLQPHYNIAPLMKHKLIKATTQLQDNICSHHDKLLEIFCRTDQQCICYLCTMDEHKGHDTVSITAEKMEKQKQIGLSQQRVKQRVQEREKELKEVQKAVESLSRSAQAAVEESERIFTELIDSVERRRSEMKELIVAQEYTAVSQAEGLMERLEQEIAELKMRGVELEKLAHTEDHIHFLESYQSLASPSVFSDLPTITVRPLPHFEDVSEAVSNLREKLEGVLKREWCRISTRVNLVDVLHPPEPKTRADFLQYSCRLTLDPHTLYRQLFLSELNRKVKLKRKGYSYPSRPDRFTQLCQVLCREGLSGRCYWEVEWSGWKIYAGVSYKDISRSGPVDDCQFGHNDKSWSLECCSNGYFFRHNNVKTEVARPQSSRVGVYLDHQAGTLSFYSVSDKMTLLHRVQTKFNQPLYPGFWLHCFKTTAELCELE